MIECNSFLEAKLEAIEAFASPDSDITSVKILYRNGVWWVERDTPYGYDEETVEALDNGY